MVENNLLHKLINNKKLCVQENCTLVNILRQVNLWFPRAIYYYNLNIQEGKYLN